MCEMSGRGGKGMADASGDGLDSIYLLKNCFH